MHQHVANLLLNIGKGVLLSALEPTRNVFCVRRGHGGAVTRMLQGLAHDEARTLATPKMADELLLSIQRHLDDLPHEELIVAIGTRRRQGPPRFHIVHRTIGDRASVAITPTLGLLLGRQLLRKNAAVLLVHNHPSNPLKTALRHAFGWRPIPSDADRALMQRFFQSGAGHSLLATPGPLFQWYLVDEGQLGEFWFPPSAIVLEWVTRIGRMFPSV